MIEMRMRYAGMKITSLFKEPGLCFYCIVCGWEKAVPAACGDPHKKPAVQSVAAGSCFGCNESGKTGKDGRSRSRMRESRAQEVQTFEFVPLRSCGVNNLAKRLGVIS